MQELILQINSRLNDFVWGPTTIAAIIGAGVYLTVGSGFVQFLRFPGMLKKSIV